MTNSALRNRAILVFTDRWKIETDIDFEVEVEVIVDSIVSIQKPYMHEIVSVKSMNIGQTDRPDRVVISSRTSECTWQYMTGTNALSVASDLFDYVILSEIITKFPVISRCRYYYIAFLRYSSN